MLTSLDRLRLVARTLRRSGSRALREAGLETRGLLRLLRDLDAYRRAGGAEPVDLRDLRLCGSDRTERTPFDAHYVYQDRWAFERVHAGGAPLHVDVGSRVDFIAMLGAVTRVVFVDLRPPAGGFSGVSPVRADILRLPFPDRSLHSLSCLHVAEHIGLGRYGDPLDPAGTAKAMAELARVVAPGGDLYLSLPVGRPRLRFNAHRVLDPARVRDVFPAFDLAEFSGVDDEGRFRVGIRPEDLAPCRYACGMFHLHRAPGDPIRRPLPWPPAPTGE
jgi:SAM-dependent methyltransferase